MALKWKNWLFGVMKEIEGMETYVHSFFSMTDYDADL